MVKRFGPKGLWELGWSSVLDQRDFGSMYGRAYWTKGTLGACMVERVGPKRLGKHGWSNGLDQRAKKDADGPPKRGWRNAGFCQ